MKKIFLIILVLISSLTFVACSSNEDAATTTNENTGSTENNDTATNTESQLPNNNVLVVYFSMPETSSPDNMTQEEDNSVVVINGEVLGNTQYVASVIHENIKSKLFRIEPATPYPTDHQVLVDQAKEEQEQSFRPEIKDQIEDFGQYDTVFIGYPNWWSDMPMIMYSFFDEYDFSGKTIIPFNTHGGSGFSSTIQTIADLEPNADVITDGLTISRDNVQESENEIIEWLNTLGIKK